MWWSISSISSFPWVHLFFFFFFSFFSYLLAVLPTYTNTATLLRTQILFAATASVLVGSYAIYAKHSGIPEIKTVLGGFVIRRFMGAQTLIIKSLGLVSIYM